MLLSNLEALIQVYVFCCHAFDAVKLLHQGFHILFGAVRLKYDDSVIGTGVVTYLMKTKTRLDPAAILSKDFLELYRIVCPVIEPDSNNVVTRHKKILPITESWLRHHYSPAVLPVTRSMLKKAFGYKIPHHLKTVVPGYV